MPRVARVNIKTITNTYHIIIRGVNKQDIFLDECDKLKFLKELKLTKDKFNFEVYLYVLMDNHVHLTICDKNDEISKIMHRLCTSYAMYFNKKYDRVGHLFQNRFKSICVDTESYLLSLIRYIHGNPQKAGICSTTDYRWSSYQDYIGKTYSGITDVDFILELFDMDRKKAIEKFKIFSQKADPDFYDSRLELDYVLTDNQADKAMRAYLHDNPSKIKEYNTKARNEIIYNISKIQGMNSKLIAKALEMSERNIQRIIKEARDKEENSLHKAKNN